MSGALGRSRQLAGWAFSAAAIALVASQGCGLFSDLHRVESGGSGGEAASGTTQGGATATTSDSTSPGGSTTASQGGSTTTTSSEGGTTTTSSTTTTSTTTSSTSTTTSTTTSSTTTSSTTTTSPGPTGSLACGSGYCDLPHHLCCWDQWGIGGHDPASGQCESTPVTQEDCDTQIKNGGVQTAITCQTKADCPGPLFCCGDVISFAAQQNQYSYYPALDCRSKCNWPSRRLCTGPGDPICAAGTTCKPSQLLPPGYFVCLKD